MRTLLAMLATSWDSPSKVVCSLTCKWDDAAAQLQAPARRDFSDLLVEMITIALLAVGHAVQVDLPDQHRFVREGVGLYDLRVRA